MFLGFLGKEMWDKDLGDLIGLVGREGESEGRERVWRYFGEYLRKVGERGR